MIRYHDGSVRYFTVFEGKRIQTFPDDYQITGAWTEAMRQIGNAVPVLLGEKIGETLFRKINPNSVIIPLTVRKISDEEIAKEPA